MRRRWDRAGESGSGAGEQREQEIEPGEDAVAGGSGDGEESGRRLGAEAVVAIVVGRVGWSYAFDGIECAMAGVRRPLIWQYCSRRVRGQEVALDSCAGGCCAASPLAVDRTRMILAAAPPAVRKLDLEDSCEELFSITQRLAVVQFSNTKLISNSSKLHCSTFLPSSFCFSHQYTPKTCFPQDRVSAIGGRSRLARHLWQDSSLTHLICQICHPRRPVTSLLLRKNDGEVSC